jgi:excisionase family DNA binding protein
VPLDDLIENQKSALTVSEVAEMLHVSRRLIYQLVTIGEVPHFKVGSAVRFEPHRLADWLRGKLEQGNKQEELARIHEAHRHAFERFGDMTEFWTKWWSEVLLGKQPDTGTQ